MELQLHSLTMAPNIWYAHHTYNVHTCCALWESWYCIMVYLTARVGLGHWQWLFMGNNVSPYLTSYRQLIYSFLDGLMYQSPLCIANQCLCVSVNWNVLSLFHSNRLIVSTKRLQKLQRKLVKRSNKQQVLQSTGQHNNSGLFLKLECSIYFVISLWKVHRAQGMPHLTDLIR